MSKYNIGDKVRISDKVGFAWSKDMKRYCGKVLTIQGLNEYGNSGALYKMFECPQWMWDNEDIVEVVESAKPAAKPTESEPAKEDKRENKRIHFYDAPESCDEELSAVISDFTDKVLKMVDKYNVERKELMDVSAKILAHSAHDDFFWKVIVPAQELVWKLAEEAKN